MKWLSRCSQILELMAVEAIATSKALIKEYFSQTKIYYLFFRSPVEYLTNNARTLIVDRISFAIAVFEKNNFSR
ncbi:MAG: hypothetical protein ACRC2R_14305 [Xenococcaceae cyanobacterium]